MRPRGATNAGGADAAGGAEPSGGGRPWVIFNPTARGERALRFRRFLDSVADAELRPTTGPGAARELAREAVQAGCGRLIAAGGDGTAFEVVNGVADADGFSRVALGVLPLGTANVFAHELGMPTDPERAWECLRTAETRRIDCGEAEYRDAKGRPCRSCFVIVAGAGLDARAVALVNWKWKRRVGKLAYIAAALRAWWSHPDRVRGELGGRVWTGRAMLAGNGRYYAGAIPVFADGRLDSGRLHLRGVDRVDAGILARCLWAYFTGRWTLGDRCPGAAVEEVEWTSAGGGAVPLELDGEFAGWLPARLRVRPGGLRVLVPAASAGVSTQRRWGW